MLATRQYLHKSEFWRDLQVLSFCDYDADAILEQEKLMLDFVCQFPDVLWRWRAEKGLFYNICKEHIRIDTQIKHNGIIIFGSGIAATSTRKLVRRIRNLVQNTSVAYVGINRFSLLEHNIDFELPDSMEQSLDLIMEYCDPRFKRLHTFDKIDGNHMAYAHPMDCYGLCK
tara:strand:+ start:104 stop:616 length:513 start_codon:yes stop_codon:yes gene_type:complete